MKKILFVALAILGGYLAKLNISLNTNQAAAQTVVPAKPAIQPLNESKAMLQDELNNIDIFKQRSPSVVFVNNVQTQADFWNMVAEDVPVGAGTGFVWDDKGHIVTNFHVVQGSDKVTINLKDGTTLDAKIVGYFDKKDIAVLKVDSSKVKAEGFSSHVADSSQLQVGQKVLAIGNPFGLDQSLSTGVISALDRPMPSIGGVTIKDMIQTDASINRGNSGGPLIDSSGRLIGMNTAIASPTGTSAGVGFAVPSNTIIRIVSQLIKSGKVTQPGLGIAMVPSNISKHYGVTGVVIQQVQPGSGAERAGLQGLKRGRNRRIEIGDIVVNVENEKIADYDDLFNALSKYKVGDVVKVTVLRGRDKKTVDVKLSEVSSH